MNLTQMKKKVKICPIQIMTQVNNSTVVSTLKNLIKRSFYDLNDSKMIIFRI